RVFAVAGTAEDGLVVAGGESSLMIVRSRGGKLASEKPIAIEQLAFAVDPAGRALVAYNDAGAGDAAGSGSGGSSRGAGSGDRAGGKLHGFVARGGAPGKVMDLGETQAGGACLTEQRGWIASPDSEAIISFDVASGEVRPEMWPKHDLLGCSATRALLQQ